MIILSLGRRHLRLVEDYHNDDVVDDIASYLHDGDDGDIQSC